MNKFWRQLEWYLSVTIIPVIGKLQWNHSGYLSHVWNGEIVICLFLIAIRSQNHDCVLTKSQKRRISDPSKHDQSPIVWVELRLKCRLCEMSELTIWRSNEMNSSNSFDKHQERWSNMKWRKNINPSHNLWNHHHRHHSWSRRRDESDILPTLTHSQKIWISCQIQRNEK
jgi:hypothetical protein